MSMELMTFQNEEFGEIRTAEIGGEPWVCLADICRPLGIRPTDVKRRLKQEGVDTINTPTKGGTQPMLFVNEANFYRAVFQSVKPEVERFTDWVTEEVLPSIRKTGSYQARLALTPAQLIAQQAQLLVEQEQRITRIEDKVDRALIAMAGPQGDRWTEDMKQAIARYCEVTGLSQTTGRGRLYAALDQEANCSTDARLRRLRDRKKKTGETRKNYMALTKLDAIAVDAKLRVAFEGVVRRMTAQAEIKGIPTGIPLETPKFLNNSLNNSAILDDTE